MVRSVPLPAFTTDERQAKNLQTTLSKRSIAPMTPSRSTGSPELSFKPISIVKSQPSVRMHSSAETYLDDIHTKNFSLIPCDARGHTANLVTFRMTGPLQNIILLEARLHLSIPIAIAYLNNKNPWTGSRAIVRRTNTTMTAPIVMHCIATIWTLK